MDKKITVKLDSELLDRFNLALAARHESQQIALHNSVEQYIRDTKDLFDRGLIKFL